MQTSAMTDKRLEIALQKPHTVLLTVTSMLLALDLVWCLTAHWTIVSRGLVAHISVALGMLLPLLLKRYRNEKRISTMIVCTSLFIVFTMAGSVVSYLLVSTDAKLVDESLARWDYALGFDWPQVFVWIKQRPVLDSVLAVAYASPLLQIIVVIVYLSMTDRHKALASFSGLLAVTFLVTEFVSAFFPAAGPFKYYANLVHADTSMLSHFEPLRSGALRAIDFSTTQGLVSIPSIHTIVAILLMLAMRETRVRLLFFLINVLVIVSTPTCGGHYLVDLIAGALTVAAIMVLWPGSALWREIMRRARIARASEQPLAGFIDAIGPPSPERGREAIRFSSTVDDH
jgi:membrane-associated phospholipid phosphatase